MLTKRVVTGATTVDSSDAGCRDSAGRLGALAALGPACGGEGLVGFPTMKWSWS